MTSIILSLKKLFKNKYENVVTLALQHMLDESESANKAFSKLIQHKSDIFNQDPPNLIFHKQRRLGDNLQPDLLGYCEDGKELYTIIEVKFWASLTENQPINYFNYLFGQESGKILIFICPRKRIDTLWMEIVRRLSIIYDVSTARSNLNTINIQEKSVTIVSWDEVLNVLESAVAGEDQNVKSDFFQLKSLVYELEKEGFIPLGPGELSMDAGRRIIDVMNLSKSLHSRVLKDERTTKSDLNVGNSQTKKMYYFMSGAFGFSIGYNLEAWSNFSETPFWLTIRDILEDGKWDSPQKAKAILETRGYSISTYSKSRFFETDINGHNIMIPIYPESGLEENELLEQMMEQISRVLDDLDLN